MNERELEVLSALAVEAYEESKFLPQAVEKVMDKEPGVNRDIVTAMVHAIDEYVYKTEE